MFKKLAIIVFLLVLVFPRNTFAQDETINLKTDDLLPAYIIKSFKSEIELQKDTTLLVKETIEINFPDERHGIYRVIPVTYSVRGKTLNTKLRVLNVTNKEGFTLPYEKSRRGQSISLKIGDPDVTVTGLQTYVISYSLDGVIQRYEEHDELYWNVTGREWDTAILRASAIFDSPYAKIDEADCFAGVVGTTSRDCSIASSENQSQFTSNVELGPGRDFTIVVALEKENGLIFPGRVERFTSSLLDNWGYAASVFPFVAMFYFWVRKGRDKRYIADTPYYRPEDAKEKTVSPFARKFLPMVYHPIQGLTPSQVGTIVDERVDIHDVVAEIVELARLGYIRIEKLEKDKLIGKDTDYAFHKLEKDIGALSEYQMFLLDKLFDEDYIEKTTKDLEKYFKKDASRLKQLVEKANQTNLTLLSSLKQKFYKHLEEFRKELYKSLNEQKIFDGKVDQVRGKWIATFVILDLAAAVLIFNFIDRTANFFPLIPLIILSVPAFFLAYSMPRKTAWGYSLYQQIRGLAFYIKKGKWRHEIAEKQLFFEEMIPLAISLEVIDKLAKDMQEIGVKAPSYFAGTTTGALYSDLHSFESRASTNLVSAPGGSGSSSWSGGSGFSGGGSSGGGFGGGGGGSW